MESVLNKNGSRKCIFILGVHRSGTSALSGILNISGIEWGANLLGGVRQSNPKGHFELKDIISLNDNILQEFNTDWKLQNPLPDTWHLDPKIKKYKQSIKSIFKKEFGNAQIFGIKDPRISLLLPIYLEVCKEENIEPLLIVTCRPDIEVAQSLFKSQNLPFTDSLDLYNKYINKIDEYTKKTQPLQVSFNNIKETPHNVLKKIQETFSIELNNSTVTKDLINDFIYTNKKEIQSDQESLIRELSEKYDMQVKEYATQVQGLESKVITLTNYINTIEQSLTWKMLSTYQKGIDVIFPKNSWIRNKYNQFIFYIQGLLIKKRMPLQKKEPHNHHATKINPSTAILEKQKQTSKKFEKRPLISIVMPTYNTDPQWLDLALLSVEKQTYTNWELHITDDKSSSTETATYLKNITNPKITTHFLSKNQGISTATNKSLEHCTGDYVCFLDHDDELTPNALFELVQAMQGTDPDILYSDECSIEPSGKISTIHYKPDFSPIMLTEQNYIGHLLCIKRKHILDAKGLRSRFDGAQDHDLLLRILDDTQKAVGHIPKVLYKWRQIETSTAKNHQHKPHAWNAGKKALEETFKRRGISGNVLFGKVPGTFHFKETIESNPLVSIIIPFKDKPEILQTALDSIIEKSMYKNYEVLCINNRSEKEETLRFIENYSHPKVTFIDFDEPFNYSRINNFGVTHTNGEYLILLNNDTEIITPDWIERMLQYAQHDYIGAVGAKLYYPENLIQHAGVIIGMGGVAGHAHKYTPREEPGYFARAIISQNISAVTGACMMIKKDTYETVEGLNEKDLAVTFNDIDFCLRLREKGYENVFTPHTELYHHESLSRGSDQASVAKQKRFNTEIQYMLERHKAAYAQGDPYYNPNLILEIERFDYV